MSPRLVGSCLGIAGLLALSVALLLPFGFGSQSEAADEVEVEPVSKDLHLINGDCPLFISFRPGDFTSDELIKAFSRDIQIEIERNLGIALDSAERITLVARAGGAVTIVRTKKPYDAAMIRNSISRYGPRRKGDDGKEAFTEKKIGGKTVYYPGSLEPYTQGWCPLDKSTYLLGSASELVNLLGSRTKRSAQMNGALKLTTEHSLVMAVDGKALRGMFKKIVQQQQEQEKRWREEKKEFKFEKKDKGKISVKLDPRLAVAVDTSADDDIDQMLKNSGFMMMAIVPYKALLKMNFALVTADVKKSYKLNAKISFYNKDDTDDGETILKYLLYVAREMAQTVPKIQPELGGLVPVLAPVVKVIKAGKIERKDKTLSLSLSYTPEAGMAKKVKDAVEAVRKNYNGGFDEKKPAVKEKRKLEEKIEKKE